MGRNFCPENQARILSDYFGFKCYFGAAIELLISEFGDLEGGEEEISIFWTMAAVNCTSFQPSEAMMKTDLSAR